jgi:hypothetical protein
MFRSLSEPSQSGATPSPSVPSGLMFWNQGSDHEKRDRVVGLAIIVSAFVLSLAISWWARIVSDPKPSPPPAPPSRESIVGFPKAVDPLKNVERARSVSVRGLLQGIEAEDVAPDGTVEMKGRSRIVYTFQGLAGEGPQPAREPDELPTRHYCGRQTVTIDRRGVYAQPDIASSPCSKRRGESLPEPRCTMADVWKRAREEGVPAKRTADIEYYRAKAGPAWRFRDGRREYNFYGDCGKRLRGDDAKAVR